MHQTTAHTDLVTDSAYTISTVNNKGGVGKTTITANIAALCADLGQRVLMIDCDPLASLTKYFALSNAAPNGLSYALSRRKIDGTCTSSTTIERLDIICHDAGMPATLIELTAAFNPAFVLETAIKQLREHDIYDIVMIDTPGAQGLLQDIGVVAAELLIAPVVPETLAAREIEPLIALLRRIEQGMPGSRQSGVQCRPIISRATNTTNARAMTADLRSMFLQTRGRFNACNTVIAASAVFDKAAANKVAVHQIEPRRNGVLGPVSATLFALVAELLPHLHERVNAELKQEEQGQ
jgi:chromosome partitioning related protein ParA